MLGIFMYIHECKRRNDRYLWTRIGWCKGNSMDDSAKEYKFKQIFLSRAFRLAGC